MLIQKLSTIVAVLFLSVFVIGTRPLGVVNADSELARVPFRRHMNLILFEARIGDSEPLTFLLDTGASGIVLENQVAERLQLNMGQPQKGGRTSQGGALSFRIAPRVSLEIGGHLEEFSSVLVTSCEGMARMMLGTTVHGIIGHSFVNRFTCEIDYVAEELVLHDPRTYEYAGGGTALNLEFDASRGGLPFTQVALESTAEVRRDVRMLVDSGGSVSGTCGVRDPEIIRVLVPPTAPRMAAMGATGLADTTEEATHRIFVTRLHRMYIGPFTLPEPTVTCGSEGGPNLSLFGAEVLHRFDVVFDYKGKRMFLSPNELFEEPAQEDASGMFLVASEEDADVRKVFFVSPESPAAEVGIEAGDELITIDGVPADRQDLNGTRALFYEPQERHELGVRRAGETLSFVLETRKLL